MLTLKQINEIKEHLEKAQNPVFFYDNDCDGLCSFLLLRRYIDRGKGVVVRSYPDLNKAYARKIEELKADYVFILDKPVIAKDFFEEVKKHNIPVVWIDHHNVEDSLGKETYENLYLYNPSKNKGRAKSSEPVSYLCYKIANRKEDLWIAIMGCIADHYMPDFASDFALRYGEYWKEGMENKEPFDAYYGTEIGKIAQSLNFGLMDSSSNIVQLQSFLLKCKNPNEILEEVEHNGAFRKRYNEIKNRYDNLIEKAIENVKGKVLFFEYGGETSMSAHIANELSFRFPEKYIVIAFLKGGIANISMRGKNVKRIIEKVLKNFKNASGGGHRDAVGGRIMLNDLERFKLEVEKEI